MKCCKKAHLCSFYRSGEVKSSLEVAIYLTMAAPVDAFTKHASQYICSVCYWHILRQGFRNPHGIQVCPFNK